MRRIASSNNNYRQTSNNTENRQQPVTIVIDDSTDEDSSIIITPSSPTRDEHLPIAVSDEETVLNPFSPLGSPQHDDPTSPPPTFNLFSWNSDDSDSSEYESSSDEEEPTTNNNIEDILDRLAREEERERRTSRQQTTTPIVQYPSMSNTNSSVNNNRHNFLPQRTTNANNTFNNSNGTLLQQQRMQSYANTNRVPLPARNRFGEIGINRPSSLSRNMPNPPTLLANNRHHILGRNIPPEHFFFMGNSNNSNENARPTFERMIEQQILAQVMAGSRHHQHIPQGVHPLMFVNRDFDDRDYEMLLALDDNLEKPAKTAASVVGKLPIVHIEEKECTCSICLEDLEVGSFASEIPFCNHKFHTDCIEKWLKDYGHTCPVCKQAVTEIDFNHAKIIQDENSNKRKDYSGKEVKESKFKKKKVE